MEHTTLYLPGDVDMAAEATGGLRQEALDGPRADRPGQDCGPVPKDPRNRGRGDVQGEGGRDQHTLGVVIGRTFGGPGKDFATLYYLNAFYHSLSFL